MLKDEIDNLKRELGRSKDDFDRVKRENMNFVEEVERSRRETQEYRNKIVLIESRESQVISNGSQSFNSGFSETLAKYEKVLS